MSYIFKITSMQLESIKVDNFYALNLDAHYPSRTPAELKLKLIVSEELNLTSFDIQNKIGSYWLGFFEMPDDLFEYHKAKNILIKKVNQDYSEANTFYSQKWDDFSVEFRKWFKNFLKPKLGQIKLVHDSIYGLV